MAETFYTVLGVADDADADAVRRAYRERVTDDHHPDVADVPDATRTFKRLTTARDVLLDEGERARYDDVGHEAYVSRHLRTDVWSAGPAETRSDPAVRGGGRRPRRDGPATADGAGDPRAHWLGDDWEGPRERHRPSGAAAGRSWQTASEVYRSRPGAHAGRNASVGFGERLRGLGPWPVVYLALVASALATAWFTAAEVGSSGSLTVAGVAVVLVAVGVAVVLSALHVLATVST